MTTPVDDALGLLGVNRGASCAELHRAYLRQLKAFSPDRDPEGYQRLRAAYDLLRVMPQVPTALGKLSSSASTSLAAPELARIENLVQEASRIESPTEWHVVREAFRQANTLCDVHVEMPVLVAVETLGVLVATGDPRSAGLLLGALSNWIERTGEARALPGDLAVHYSVMRDLVAVAVLLPQDVARWLGRHILRLRMDRVAALLSKNVATNPLLVEKVLFAVRRSKSPFAQQIRVSFEQEQAVERLRRKHRIRDRMLLVVALCFGFICLLCGLMLK